MRSVGEDMARNNRDLSPGLFSRDLSPGLVGLTVLPDCPDPPARDGSLIVMLGLGDELLFRFRELKVVVMFSVEVEVEVEGLVSRGMFSLSVSECCSISFSSVISIYLNA